MLLISRGGFGVEVSHVLFGQITAVTRGELLLNLALGAIALVIVALCFRDLELTSLDPGTPARSGCGSGSSTRWCSPWSP